VIEIRREKPEDIAAISYVHKQAFESALVKSGVEATLSDRLRDKGLVTLSLVAVQDERVVGHILFSPMIIMDDNTQYDVLTLSIISVVPEFQRKGIGSQLIKAGHDECCRLGHEIIILFGHPWYYPRFGYVPARSKRLECRGEIPDEVFMVVELVTGALDGKNGMIQYHPEHRAILFGQ